MTRKEKVAQKRMEILGTIADNAKKYFTGTHASTLRLDAKPLPEFIAQLMKVTVNEASRIISKDYEVTVNGTLVTDVSFTLHSGDVVRAENGHFLLNGYIAVVK